jgi:hypothetical protein
MQTLRGRLSGTRFTIFSDYTKQEAAGKRCAETKSQIRQQQLAGVAAERFSNGPVGRDPTVSEFNNRAFEQPLRVLR